MEAADVEKIHAEFRYILRRRIEYGAQIPLYFPTVPCNQHLSALWCMLNSSTATATVNDPTVGRVIDFTRSWRYGRAVVVNLGAARSPDPSELPEFVDPIGPENDHHIRREAHNADLIVVAWGMNHKYLPGRADRVIQMLRDYGNKPLWCLGTTADGSPQHPLYLPKTTTLELYRRTID